SAWWAFNRLGTLAAQRWGDMSKDVREVWDPMQKKLLENQESFEEKAKRLKEEGKEDELIKYLTDYSNKWGNKVVERAWKLGDELWTKYDEKF
ncbi:MAG: dipeptidase, partial [Bacteroidota bacterium]